MTSFIATFSIALFAVLSTAGGAFAGPGHDHGDPPAATAGDHPRRLPDGSVFLPKPGQRQLELRTQPAERGVHARSVELAGRVVADPNAGGRVQPTVPGRIEAGPGGLPRLGQAVARGQVLAMVRSSAAPLERANQVALGAELRAGLDVARRRLARLEQLEDTIPRKDLEAARADATGLAQRLAAVEGSVSAAEALRAPVAGVIAASNVVAGQVVDARDTLFEIVDPSRLLVEALAYDATLAGRVRGASASPAAGVRLPLVFSGAGRILREGAIPLQFRTAPAAAGARAADDPPPLSIHQPVRVLVRTDESVDGFALPAAAVVRNAANQDIVWVHAAAEHFVPRGVRQLPLDGATVAVVDGLWPGDRVVTQGAALLNQVR
jgi:biotin carboxyl carrier protein